MTKKYNDEIVTVVRDAREGDDGFVRGASDGQVLVRLPNGDEKAVPKSDIKDSPPA